MPTRIGKKKKRTKGPDTVNKLPQILPHTRCRLKQLRQERVKDYLLMEEEFISNQERMRPQEEKQEEERTKVDDLRGSPMAVGSLEEIIDDNHAIVSTSVGSEHYVSILSFVDKDLLEPGCTVLLNHKVRRLCFFFNGFLLPHRQRRLTLLSSHIIYIVIKKLYLQRNEEKLYTNRKPKCCSMIKETLKPLNKMSI